MSILEEVNDLISNKLTGEVAEYIADHFGLDSKEVSNVLKNYLKQLSTPVRDSKPMKKSIVSIKPKCSTVNECKFIITRGIKQGQKCGTTIRGEGEFCSKHRQRTPN